MTLTLYHGIPPYKQAHRSLSDRSRIGKPATFSCMVPYCIESNSSTLLYQTRDG